MKKIFVILSAIFMALVLCGGGVIISLDLSSPKLSAPEEGRYVEDWINAKDWEKEGTLAQREGEVSAKATTLNTADDFAEAVWRCSFRYEYEKELAMYEYLKSNNGGGSEVGGDASNTFSNKFYEYFREGGRITESDADYYHLMVRVSYWTNEDGSVSSRTYKPYYYLRDWKDTYGEYFPGCDNNGVFWERSYKLGRNLNMAGKNLHPLDCASLDGNGHAIYGIRMYIESEHDVQYCAPSVLTNTNNIVERQNDDGTCLPYFSSVSYDTHVGVVKGSDSIYDNVQDPCEIKNITLSGLIQVSNSSGTARVGGAIGSGNAKNVVNADLDVRVDWPVEYVGGIVGEGSATDCVNANHETDSGTPGVGLTGGSSDGARIGGIIGSGTVKNCMNRCRVYASSIQTRVISVGGIAGYSDSVKGCVNSGDVSSWHCGYDANRYSSQGMGGIVGNAGGTIENCFNYGKVDGPGYMADWKDVNVGGIVGDTKAVTIKNCANFGTVDGGLFDTRATGGFGGILGSVITDSGTYNVNISNCGNYGSISTYTDDNSAPSAGGVVGWAINTVDTTYVTIDKCVNYGYVGGSGGCNYVGHANGDTAISNCWRFSKTTGTYRYFSDTYGGSAPSLDNCRYTSSDFSSTRSLYNKLTNSTYWSSVYSYYNSDGQWFVIPDGYCGFSESCSITGGNWSYLVVPMAVFREMDVQMYWSKPSQTDVGQTYEEETSSNSEISCVYNTYNSSTQSDYVFVNGVHRQASFRYWYNSDYFTFKSQLATSKGRNLVSTQTTVDFTNFLTDGIVYAVPIIYGKASSSPRTKFRTEGGYTYFDTFLFVASSYKDNNIVTVRFDVASKSKKVKFSYSGEGEGRAEIVVPSGHYGRTADGYFYYKDTFHIKVTPYLGSKVYSIAGSTSFTVNGENGCGEATRSNFLYKLQTNINVVFDSVIYKAYVINLWDSETSREYTMINNSAINFVAGIGYQYRLYEYTGFNPTTKTSTPLTMTGNYATDLATVQDKSKHIRSASSEYMTLNLKIENSVVNLGFSIDYLDIIDLDRDGNYFTSIYTDRFYLYVDRQEIEFKFYLQNRTDKYDDSSFTNSLNTGLDYYSENNINPRGGNVWASGPKDSKGLFLSEGFTLSRNTFYGYEFYKTSFTDATTSTAVANASSVNLNGSRSLLLNYMLWKYGANYSQSNFKYDDNFDNDGRTGDTSIDLYMYNYFKLDKYPLTIEIKVDSSTVSSVSGFGFSANVEGRQGNIGNAPINAAAVYYLVPITISGNFTELTSGVYAYSNSNYIFAGFYLSDGKLLNNQKGYKFANDNLLEANLNASKRLTSLNIVAQFYSLSTTSSTLGDTRKVYNVDSSNDLMALSKAVANGTTFENCIINQTADINMNGVEFAPIGNGFTTFFKGVYNGNNYRILNLNLGGEKTEFVSNRGLFGGLDGAT
ncbi:MAG: hypothetical protein J6J24_00115, partial [Clostridia bacterium]|nr:hypothetical protein [Clostridia bacterium]